MLPALLRPRPRPRPAPPPARQGREDALDDVRELAPPDHTVTASTSTLCKLLGWVQDGLPPLGKRPRVVPRLIHQVGDWFPTDD